MKDLDSQPGHVVVWLYERKYTPDRCSEKGCSDFFLGRLRSWVIFNSLYDRDQLRAMEKRTEKASTLIYRKLSQILLNM